MGRKMKVIVLELVLMLGLMGMLALEETEREEL